MRSAVTISLVPEARPGPFVFWDGLEAGIKEAAALGFDGVEIFPPSPEAVPADLAELLKAHGLALAALGTGAGALVRKLTLTSPDATVRRDACAFIKGMIDRAAEFGAPAIIGSMQGRAATLADRSEALALLAEALEELGDHAGSRGTVLLYEPLNRYETNLLNRQEEAADFLSGLKTPYVRVLADLFHMNIEEPSLPDAIVALGTRLGHVHLADSNRRAAGFGHMNFAPIITALRAVGYQGWLSAEVLALPVSTAAAAKTIQSFRSLLSC